MPKKITHEEYIKKVEEINPNIEVIEKYVGAKIQILHKCKIDGCIWLATPSNILQGTGCPECGRPKQKTHEEYVLEVAQINPNIEVIEKYQGHTIKILHRCKIDGHMWLAAPNNILNSKGCPVCGKISRKINRTKTHETYVLEVANLNPTIEVIDIYINSQTKILHRCKIDGCEWLATPFNILSGKGCPRCSGLIKKTHEEYVGEVSKLNPDIEVIGQYINAHTKILHRCKIDGYEWYAKPNNILNGKGCPVCHASKGEKLIASWLDKKNISYKSQKTFSDCKDKYVLRFDFYLRDYNILIEYNGKQHYEPVEYFGGKQTFEKQILRDKIKKEYCKNNNIFLFEIPYYSDLNKELEDLYKLITMLNIQKGVSKVA